DVVRGARPHHRAPADQPAAADVVDDAGRGQRAADDADQAVAAQTVVAQAVAAQCGEPGAGRQRRQHADRPGVRAAGRYLADAGRVDERHVQQVDRDRRRAHPGGDVVQGLAQALCRGEVDLAAYLHDDRAVLAVQRIDQRFAHRLRLTPTVRWITQ